MNPTTEYDDIHVLHVDDNPDFGDLVATFLSRHDGVVVHSETDPNAALERLDAVDCLVSDYDMPGLNGLELLERVRTRRPDLPFVLFTGKGNEEIASDAIAAGVDGYVQKGGGSEQYELLVNRIRTVVSEARATRRAQEMSDQLQKVYERTADGVVAVDREWRYTYVNARAAEVLGVDPTDVLGTEVWTVFPTLVGSVFETELRRAMETDESVSLDAYFEPLETHFDVRAFPGEDGLSIYFSDVTDEQYARRQLASERRLLDAALDALGDVFYVLDDSGERLVRWNDELTQVTGLTDAELACVSVTDLFIPADRDAVAETVEYVLGGEEATGTARFASTGGPRVFDFHTVPLYNENDVLVGACGIGRDVSHRQEREATLRRQRDQLDEFAVVVSHDLQNPLAVALGHVHLALETGSTDRLGAAADALERMDALIDDLLERARTGSIVDDPQPVALGDVITEAWAVTDTADATLVIDDDLPLVSADPSRLGGLFENLFRNAIEHGLMADRGASNGEGGRLNTNGPEAEYEVEHAGVSVDTAEHHHRSAAFDSGAPPDDAGFEVRVGSLGADGRDGFYVEDNGPGFDRAADPDELFDPGVSTTPDGTGYGLAIVRDITEGHGWTVDATTGPRGGARFEFGFTDATG